MTYVCKEGEAPPLCRYCGKPIRKHTTTLYFKLAPSNYDTGSSGGYSYGPLPQTREEAQQRTNGTVVSINRNSYRTGQESKGVYEGLTEGKLVRGEVIESAGIWDGQSYWDQYFCTNAHAQAFANFMAKAGHVTNLYNTAVAARAKAKAKR